ncbi:hypothetical protein [Pseudomonas sp. P8_241]|uniref:hypothetical protein n=1 Tax=Pseudomonas sp. P8_241 TaxID=3043445 RepID=UPI002A363038|nr:hypothetical protein [Pseudomonas sp. P8_241]WPN45124.1 hypothetical protein QMK58_18255 [Pseudomonas sp. P8_241]
MLDADQANITFKNVKDMKDKAKKWISSDLSKPILSLRPEDESLIHAAIAMRNFIAHESQKSRRLMNEALRKLGDHSDHSDLKISHKDVKTVGAYLKAFTNNGPRFLSLAVKLGNLAEKLDPNVKSVKARQAKERRMKEF